MLKSIVKIYTNTSPFYPRSGFYESRFFNIWKHDKDKRLFSASIFNLRYFQHFIQYFIQLDLKMLDEILDWFAPAITQIDH